MSIQRKARKLISFMVNSIASFLRGAIGPRSYVQTEKRLVCYRISDRGIERLHPIETPEGPINDLSNDLLQPPGQVRVSGQVFRVEEPGIYRWHCLPNLSEQRLVGPEKDVEDLLSYIGCLWMYGGDTLRTRISDPREMLKTEVFMGTCGFIALTAQSVLTSLGFKVRLVAGVTLERWDGMDDGHTLLEVFTESSGWVAYDPSHSSLFRGSTKGRDLRSIIGSSDFSFETLRGNTGRGLYRKNGYDFGFWMDERILSRDRLTDWYRRTLQVPLVESAGVFFYPLDSVRSKDRERLEQIHYKGIPRFEFDRKFYSG